MRAADPLLLPWLDRLRADVPGLELYDAHTHIGRNDPDGFKQEPGELHERLDAAGARGVVFPMHETEPGAYPPANDEVLAAAAESSGKLVAFARLNPREDALGEARRCFDAGARGIKLHPRAEQFAMTEPVVGDLVAFAHERRAPILIHAGRGIPALGRHTLELSERYPQARFILAHAAITDLAWIWRELPDHPNVLIDTSWWSPADLCALHQLVAPGQVLWASDSPYGTPVEAAIVTLRCALHAGYDAAQLRGMSCGQLERVIAWEDLLDLGAAPAGEPGPRDVLLDRVADHLLGALQRAIGAIVRGLSTGEDEEPLALARLACAVPEDAEQAPVSRSILALLDRLDDYRRVPADERLRFSDLHFVVCALAIARTPSVPVPVL